MRDLKEIKTALKITKDLENEIQKAVKDGKKVLHFGFELNGKEGIDAILDNVTRGVIDELENAEYNYTILTSKGSNTVRIDIEF